MAKKQSDPTPAEFVALYDAARRFRKAEPWLVMGDSDVFGVRDPETGATGYCCVMGQLGEYHAMHVYLGGEGIAGYRAMQQVAGDSFPDEPCQLNLALVGESQTNLVVEFLDAAKVPRAEKTRIKVLGLSFRGRIAWPVFERNDPGLEARGLDAGEARFLTAAIEQALLVADRFRHDETIINGPLDQNLVLIRVPVAGEGATVWRDVVEAFETVPEPISDPVPDEVLRAFEALPVRKAFVELAHTFMPALVKSRKAERGMYPRMLLAVDSRKGIVLGFHLFEDGEFPKDVLAVVAAMLVTFGMRPSHLVLSDPWLHRLIGNGIPILKPSLKLVRCIEAAEDAFLSLSGFMSE